MYPTKTPPHIGSLTAVHMALILLAPNSTHKLQSRVLPYNKDKEKDNDRDKDKDRTADVQDFQYVAYINVITTSF